ncbi:MAG TPA: putative baseplate assembly protein [Methanotrichaceae archaeon]|nr:putative baseplate assembly protein [Methanotrichaceae archaeon]
MNRSEVCNEERRRQILSDPMDGQQTGLNGIDYIEVADASQKGCTLKVYLFGKLKGAISRENVRIEGGRRIRNIGVTDVKLIQSQDPDQDDFLRIELDKLGDMSNYTLKLVNAVKGRHEKGSLAGFDPVYSQADFSFAVLCHSDLDCKVSKACPPERREEPDINYLAKDYSSFRRLILDRIALIMPGWQERHIPDVGIALAELLAYVGDYLSYYQDAVATEAYLGTARRRTSVRRHVRLVDYHMHEGCNARAWVFVKADTDIDLSPENIYFITSFRDGSQGSAAFSAQDLEGVPEGTYKVFEPLLEASGGLLEGGDIIDPGGLIGLMKASQNPRDEIALCFYNELSMGTREMLDDYKEPGQVSPELLKALIYDLNRLIIDGCISKHLLARTFPQEIRSSSLHISVANNEIPIYTWCDTECCLPKGATSATLLDSWVVTGPGAEAGQIQGKGPAIKPKVRRSLNLKPGDFLLFEEVLGPRTNRPEDADSSHRQVVRLTKVSTTTDPLLTVSVRGIQKNLATPLVAVEWSAEDALSFPLCISSQGQVPECAPIPGVSVARGNIILVDHGRTVKEGPLGPVPCRVVTGKCECGELPAEVSIIPDTFQPCLKKFPLTFSQPLPQGGPAKGLLDQDPRKAAAQVWLLGMPTRCMDGPREWNVRHDLLGSSGDDDSFVSEIDEGGTACLRFGDGELGRMPDAGTEFSALYRVGNGIEGNVGAESISAIVFRQPVQGAVSLVRNPLPAEGGSDPEPIEEVRLLAPGAFRHEIQRCVTADDYAEVAQRNPKIQRAAAALGWTGSWYEVQVAVDPLGKEEADQDLLEEIYRDLQSFRRIGHDLRVTGAQYVPLDISLDVCIKPGYLRAHVVAALLDAFGNKVLPDGSLGFFHPDNLTFGEGIYLSRLVSTAQSVDGVESVKVGKLQRLGEGPNNEIESGLLRLGPLEIAQMDNDPNFPERGWLKINPIGGR